MSVTQPIVQGSHFVILRENYADSEDIDPRRSHPEVFYIDVNSIPLFIVETFAVNQRLCGMI
jgi:hypothetical protein